MNIHKRISTKIAIIIIVLLIVFTALFIFGFFTVSKCNNSSSFRNPNLISFNPEPATNHGCYFKWQCQFVKNEKSKERCYDQFDD